MYDKHLEEIKARAAQVQTGIDSENQANIDRRTMLADIEQGERDKAVQYMEIVRLKEQVETLKKEYAHYKRISEEADKQIALLKDKKANCDGCAYKIDFPSSVHCFGCARMYSDHYAADNKHWWGGW